MGYSLSWVALKGGDLQTVCAALNLRPTGKREEIAESKIDGAQLPTGWYLLLFDHAEIEDRTLEKLSKIGEVISCFVEDHVMFSSASNWGNGKELWKIWHDGGELGRMHLETRGKLPPEYEEIRRRLFDEQAAADRDKEPVDYVYELPAELAKHLTGFRHDQDMAGLPAEPFEVLEPAKPLAFFSRWFGR